MDSTTVSCVDFRNDFDPAYSRSRELAPVRSDRSRVPRSEELSLKNVRFICCLVSCLVPIIIPPLI